MEEKNVHETSGHAEFSSVVQIGHVRVERLDERAIPVPVAACCVMGESDDGEANVECLPILVMKFDVGNALMPHKGTKHPWGAMVQSGFPKIIVKIDIEVVLEESEEYVSQTGGFDEQAVQAFQRKLRTLKFSVEELHGVSLPPTHPLLVWAVECATQITHRSCRYTNGFRNLS